MKNKLMGVILSFVILLSSLLPCFAAIASSDLEKSYHVYNGISYVVATPSMFTSPALYGGRVSLNNYVGDDENVYIPKNILFNGKEYPVTFNNSFSSNKTIKNVLFENGVYVRSLYTAFSSPTIETVLIEDNGHFANEGSNLNMQYTFKNAYMLKEYFDISNINSSNIFFTNCVSLKHITSLPKAAKVVQINNYLKEYSYTSVNLESIDCEIPEKCTSFLLQARNVSGDIVFCGNSTSINISSASNSSYFNHSSLTLYVPNNSKTLDLALKFVGNGRHTIKVETTDGSDIEYEEIFALGDSLTAGNYYIPQLNELLPENKVAYNYGVESDQTIHGMRRMGIDGYDVKVKNRITIPKSSQERVEVELSEPYTAWANKVGQDTSGINCVSIRNIEGILTLDASDNKTYFRRLNDGAKKNVLANTIIETELSKHYTIGDTLIIYLGTNDHTNTTERGSEELAEKIQSILDCCQPKKYVVVGIATGSCSNENNTIYEKIMKKHFGYHFLNLRKYFIDNAYSICSELEISEEEQKKIDAGIIPSEFYNDGLHWNKSTGGRVVAKAIAEKLEEVDSLYEHEKGGKHSYKITKTVAASKEADGYYVKTCTVCGLEKESKIPKIKKICLNETSFLYSGKEIKPVVSVVDNNNQKVSAAYYLVTYSNNVKTGTATVKIRFYIRYKGTEELNFVIKPKPSQQSVVKPSVSFSDSLLSTIKRLFSFDDTNETVVRDHLYGSTVNSTLGINKNYTNTNYGYGVRIKTPRSPITKVYVKTLVTEECDLTCTIVSADMVKEYTSTKTRVKPDDTECCFEFNSLLQPDENEIYLLVTAPKSVLCEGMTSLKSPNSLNGEIGAANAKIGKTGNVYCADGENWLYRASARSDEKNIYGLIAYVYCRNDTYSVVNHTLYVAPNGSDETGDGSQQKPYASIYKANSTITDSNYFNRYTIKVADGEYNDMSTRENNNDARSIVCKNYVTYEGNTERPEKCVIVYDGSQREYGHECTYSDVQTKAIFEISRASRVAALGINTQIKGFKLVGKNLRYVLHFDTAGAGIGGNWDIGNLIIDYYGNPDCVNDEAKHYAIGCGMAQCEVARYHDITFTGTQKTYSGMEYKNAYFGHNNAHNQQFTTEEQAPCLVDFINVDFNNGNIVLSTLQNLPVDFFITNCSNLGRISKGDTFNTVINS